MLKGGLPRQLARLSSHAPLPRLTITAPQLPELQALVEQQRASSKASSTMATAEATGQSLLVRTPATASGRSFSELGRPTDRGHELADRSDEAQQPPAATPGSDNGNVTADTSEGAARDRRRLLQRAPAWRAVAYRGRIMNGK